MSLSPSEVSQIIKAYDVRGLVGEQIDASFVTLVGRSFGRLMKEEGASRVVVGHDMRDSSPELSQAFAEGVTQWGVDVTHIGLASTDQLYYASGVMKCPGAMFTASHNPAQYNGIKLCRAEAKPVGQESGLKQISQDVVDEIPAGDCQPGTMSTTDVLEDYAQFLRDLVDLSAAKKLTVAVDAGNGMGGHTVPAVLGPVGCDIRPLYFELDGNFPNHEANPLEPANLVDLQAFVKETGAHIGLAFDGDADRCFVVDEKGDPVSPSAISALVAQRELEKAPGSTIIYNLITSLCVPQLVEELGGKAVRTRVGHSFIKAEMASTGAVFGGEHSAHYYFQAFWGADSGMLAAMHVLAALSETDQPLSALMAKYNKFEQSGEINSKLPDAAAQQERSDAVREAFTDRATSIDTLDGVTIQLAADEWFNVRASNTEPLLRLNVEAATQDRVQEIVDEVVAIIRA